MDAENSLTTASDSDKQDIVQFITKESLLQKKQSDQVIIETYACTLWKGFFDMKHKLYKIPNLDVLMAIDMGIQLVDNLFWILFHYSSNLQLTLFLSERGRLLYTEFLSMSRTHQLMKQMNSFPSISDGFMFAIKKSIGSLTCAEHHAKIKFNNISIYRISFRRIFEIINRKYLVPCPAQRLTNSDVEKHATLYTPSAAHPTMTSENDPWSDDKVNITLHSLNHLMSIAIHMSPDSFERCVYARQNYNIGLSEFFLLLKLVSDTINTHHHVSPEHMQQIFLFIEEHRAHITPNQIDCLDDEHFIQQRWQEQKEKSGPQKSL